ncbi:MAG TPA: 4Fe-4S ferredoxin [Bacteroidales bacterium]|nr:MAG: 4Fe-4S ferredoxin [Bacteroidetes bacterium GWE2_42_24]OFY28105.1 MAG: 4Fe-4S ferredoxin [Bacteroidetes bacterium GWF2_43_11]HAQ64577.1 4Fe-4S ferredoxin [Bacteroidales bacterium]HBZ65485.1 4Fe-4S ferredoxin [Bacteroidales bacterium]
MEVFVEQLITYGLLGLFAIAVVVFYLRKLHRESHEVGRKIALAKAEGLYEPVSLHPVVDPKKCIKTGACVAACPEKDILGILNGKATVINASRCIGHGACFHACPTEAITLCIGTEQRGVELPHVGQTFETNVPGIFIAGELGGMGLIRNAVEQGRQAVDNLVKSSIKNRKGDYDLIIVGAGPAGISAALNAKKHGLRFLALEQDTLGGTVFSFPRSKIVMTSPMMLPLHGKVKLYETGKQELLNLWNEVLGKHAISIQENTKVETVINAGDHFLVDTEGGEQLSAKAVLLAVGRRGTPRKLGIPGENTEKVAYRLIEADEIRGKNIVVVGGGDSAIESALLLAEHNKVVLSYRSEKFNRIKPKNSKKINEAMASSMVNVRFNTQLTSIEKDCVHIVDSLSGTEAILENDLVYVFAGGELPIQFLEKAGIVITKKFGEAILTHIDD